MTFTPGLADCHLHLEGSLPVDAVTELARRAGHRFGDPRAFEAARSAVRDPGSFLELYSQVCRLFRSPSDYGFAARGVARSLTADGVAYAEVYVSPDVPARFGFDPHASLREVDQAFRDAEAAGGTRCRILLDAVRQWGPESAERVLDVHERTRLPSVVGFGLGGEEESRPAADFAGVYARARALGLRTSVHAGEWAGVSSLTDALDSLRPDRIDHGIAAVHDPHVLARLAEEGTPLWIAPTSNVVTGAVASLEEHPLPRLLDAGVHVAIGADDPVMFGTTTAAEHRLVQERFGFGERTMRQLRENAWRFSFCPALDREHALRRAPARSSQPSVSS